MGTEERSDYHAVQTETIEIYPDRRDQDIRPHWDNREVAIRINPDAEMRCSDIRIKPEMR